MNTLPTGVTAAQFDIKIDDEVIIVGAIGGTGNKTWSSLTRGARGTTAASHVDGSNVYLVTTSGGFAQWWADLLSGAVTDGTHASRPAAATSLNGNVYFETDTGRTFICISAAWVQIAVDTRVAIYKSSSADITLTTSTTLAEIDSALRLTVAAVTGDILELAINGYMSYGNKTIHFDASTVVSGALTNAFSPASATVGAPGWYKSLTGTAAINQVTPPLQGSVFYVVQSGDISSGNVTVTLTACNESSGGTAGKLLRSNGLTLCLKNHRQ